MLSPGRFHKRIPKDRLKNLTWRRNVCNAARYSAELRADLWEKCRQDILFYVNTFVWQYNPRKIGQALVGPFLTWDFQDEAFRKVLDSVACTCGGGEVHQHDILIEKSREMGASWLCLIVMEWLWHFHPWQKMLCISRNEEAVESEDPDSLFWKIDFIHRNQPDWLLPAMKRRKKYYGNTDNGSTITGQASTGKAGIGGRATLMFIDEFSLIHEAHEVQHHTSDTTGCRLFNGTHRGEGTAFHELSVRPDMRKLVMHWSQHPDKRKGRYRYDAASNKVEVLDKTYPFPPEFPFVMVEAPAGGPHPGVRSPWYDEECGRKGSARAVAMDLDIDPAGSSAQFFNPVTLRILRQTHACSPYWEGDLTYDRQTGRPQGLVKLDGGPVKLWLTPRHDGTLPASRYCAGADIATGSGASNSCLSIADARTGEKVMEYATANLTAEVFAPLCTALCWLFKDENREPALFAWEHKGPGMLFGDKVVQLGYPCIYHREAHQSLRGGAISNIPGWNPTPDSKRMLLEDYRAALDQRLFVNRSDIAIRECLPYRYNPTGNVEHPRESTVGDDPTGARVNHGDRVIADALVWMLIRKSGLATQRQKEEREPIPVGTLAWRRHLAGKRESADPYAEQVAFEAFRR